MKIGIFGGSFNPPHLMHEKIGVVLVNEMYLDKVIYVPTGNSYTKKDLLSAQHRINMLKLLTEKYNFADVSDYELKSRLVSTYQTLDYFKSIYPNDDIYFILGADNLAELDTWKRYDYLLENYKFLVIKRKGQNIDRLLSKYSNSENLIVTDVDMIDISSTAIREMLKKKSTEALKYVDKNVYNYIIKHTLYN